MTKGETQKQLRRVGTLLLLLLTHARANINASFWEWVSLPELLPRCLLLRWASALVSAGKPQAMEKREQKRGRAQDLTAAAL